MKKNSYYKKVADLYNALGMPIEQDASFTINNLQDIHQSLPYKSPVFRINYYSFIFVKIGKGNYTSDEQTFECGDRDMGSFCSYKRFEYLDLTNNKPINLLNEIK